MGAPSVPTKRMAAALAKNRGLITVTARELGIRTNTIYSRLKKSAALREVLQEARDFTGDVAEAKLFQKIQEGEGWAICFYLKCQRGWVDHHHVQHSGEVGVNLNVSVNYVHASSNGDRPAGVGGAATRRVPPLQGPVRG